MDRHREWIKVFHVIVNGSANDIYWEFIFWWEHTSPVLFGGKKHCNTTIQTKRSGLKTRTEKYYNNCNNDFLRIIKSLQFFFYYFLSNYILLLLFFFSNCCPEDFLLYFRLHCLACLYLVHAHLNETYANMKSTCSYGYELSDIGLVFYLLYLTILFIFPFFAFLF